jgi:hypothetical protein
LKSSIRNPTSEILETPVRRATFQNSGGISIPGAADKRRRFDPRQAAAVVGVVGGRLQTAGLQW